MKSGASGTKRIYLDYAAATPLDPRVAAAMKPYWRDVFGNAGSSHEEGRAAKAALEDARERVASCLNARPDEITFTSGGTEANNLAVLGTIAALRAKGVRGGHVVTSAIEHPSVLDVFHHLEREGMAVSYLPVGRDGCVDERTFRETLVRESLLVSVMQVNSEIGTIQPIRALAKSTRKHRGEHSVATPYFHVDASQAPLFLECRPEVLGADLLTLDAQKLYGPKGVGVLYHKRGVPLSPILFGGGHEAGLRPGTENIPLIVGFAAALEIAVREYDEAAARVSHLRDRLIQGVGKHIPDAHINGSQETRVANNVSVTVPGTESDYLVALLDVRGIAAGTKSACLANEDGGSYVLAALGDGSDGPGAVRFSLGKETTQEDIDRTVLAFAESVALARRAPSSVGRKID